MLHEVPGVTSMMVGTGVSATVGPGICESIVCKAGAINGVMALATENIRSTSYSAIHPKSPRPRSCVWIRCFGLFHLAKPDRNTIPRERLSDG